MKQQQTIVDLINVRIGCILLVFIGYMIHMFHPFQDLETQFYFHPLQPNPFSYTLDWYLVYISDTLRPFLYLLSFLLFYKSGFLEIRPCIHVPGLIKFRLKLSLLHWFMIYEFVLFLDFLITFRQSPAREIIGYFYCLIVTTYYWCYYNQCYPKPKTNDIQT